MRLTILGGGGFRVPLVYRALLDDPSTFSSMTLEELLQGRALPAKARAALRERYIVRYPTDG